MTESVQRLRTNRTIEGRECGWCHVPLDFGDPAVVCQACSSVTHGVCWDAKGGCPTDECVNRPLRKLDEPAAPSPLAELQAIPPSPAGNQAAGGTLYDPGVASRPGGTPYQPAAAVSPAAAQAGETLYEPGAMMHGLKKTCPHCGLQIDADSMLCRYCNMVPDRKSVV